MFGNVLAVADHMVGDLRIASFECVGIGAARQAIHPLMNDACEIFQRRRRPSSPMAFNSAAARAVAASSDKATASASVLSARMMISAIRRSVGVGTGQLSVTCHSVIA